MQPGEVCCVIVTIPEERAFPIIDTQIPAAGLSHTHLPAGIPVAANTIDIQTIRIHETRCPCFSKKFERNGGAALKIEELPVLLLAAGNVHKSLVDHDGP